MTKYSDALVAKMHEIGSFTYTSAKQFADENGLPFRSVVAKLNALQIPYQKKDSKEPSRKVLSSRSKAEIVASIERHVGSALASLTKMTVADLEQLEKAVA